MDGLCRKKTRLVLRKHAYLLLYSIMIKTSILDAGKLQAFAKERKLQPFRIKQIYQEIFNNQNINFSDMTTLSKDLREDLDKHFSVVTLKVDKMLEDKTTTKI